MFDLLILAAAKSELHAKQIVEYHDTMTLNPLGALVMCLSCIWLLCSKRHAAIYAMLAIMCLVPEAQRILVLGGDFRFLRILAICGAIRVVLRGEFRSIQWNRVDLAFACWAVLGGGLYIAQQGSSESVIYILGGLIDSLGGYFFFRAAMKEESDFRVFIRAGAILAAVIAAVFLVEASTRYNLFSYFGGVPAITLEREGRLRCQGAFSHPIIAGVFWAGMLPLFVGLLSFASERLFAIVGIFASLIIIATTASSTPLLGVVACLLMLTLWSVRGVVRWGWVALPFLLTALHFVMEAPVWHLVSRVTAVGGSTGMHRFILIDCAIKRFPEWWLVGSTSTGHWHQFYQTWDITNQYILEGVKGGVMRLILFVWLIYSAAESIATGLRKSQDRQSQWLLWCLGTSLFVHGVCFIGVAYFGQITFLWTLTLAVAASVSSDGFSGDSNEYYLIDDPQFGPSEVTCLSMSVPGESDPN
ncbi:O-antigen ligase family protein [Aureliella helgolandensis]|uniref:O-Antigen ligase n=1 Tax=Aureliella helgolandensis TaxID=2527968 RepID=A0A518GFF0_9BACT|nr:hypothetical protein [Aureliella helgolandensis]QDV27325.1 hypothetical protein Q31a_57130 [Aureliella helgolandensis]